MVVGVGLQGREQDGGDVINLVALGLFYSLFITAVFADARDHPLVRAVRLLDPTGLRDVKSVILVSIGVLIVRGINGMSDHLAVCPDSFTINFDRSVALIVVALRVFISVIAVRYDLYLKQSGTGLIIHRKAIDDVFTREVDDIIAPAIVDIQSLFCFFFRVGGIHRAVLKIQNERILSAASSIRKVDRISKRIDVKCAVVERHFCTRIVPQCVAILFFRRIEHRIDKF